MQPQDFRETTNEGSRSVLSPWSCFNCRRRKVRCDRHNPCAHCSKGGLQCCFPVSGRLPTRRHDPAALSSSTKKQAELVGRLRRLESIVEDLSAQLEHDSQTLPSNEVDVQSGLRSQSDMASHLKASDARAGDKDSVQQATQLAGEFGKLIVNKDSSIYVRHRFWHFLSGEVKKILGALEEVSHPDEEAAEEQLLAAEASTLPFSRCTNDVGGASLQPLPSQIPFIWQIFIENVDPFLKVLHVPTMNDIIRDSKGMFRLLSPGMEALMYSICLAAVTSLGEDEVLDNFGDTRHQLISRFTVGAEQALIRAGVFNTADPTVVRAFLIYLEFAGESYGSRAIWISAGLLVRTAISMGLHRDASNFSNVCPFETEMRRRLWWHICFLDVQVGDCDVSKGAIHEADFDTREPVNANDADLRPDMTHEPAARDSYTDVSLCLMRCELWRLTRRVQSSIRANAAAGASSQQTTDRGVEIVDSFKASIKQNHLRLLSPDNALHSFSETVACLTLTRHDLIVRHADIFHNPSDLTAPSTSDTDDSFLPALATLEHAHALAASPATGRWAWTMRRSVQWHALGVLLAQLCTRPWGPTSERAWAVVRRTLRTLPEEARCRSPRAAIRRLAATIRSRRADEIRRLRARPAVFAQLGRLAAHHPADEWVVGAPAGRTEFDTAAAEQRLAAETAVCLGEWGDGMCGGGPGIIVEEGGPSVDWVDVWGDLTRACLGVGTPVSASVSGIPAAGAAAPYSSTDLPSEGQERLSQNWLSQDENDLYVVGGELADGIFTQTLGSGLGQGYDETYAADLLDPEMSWLGYDDPPEGDQVYW